MLLIIRVFKNWLGSHDILSDSSGSGYHIRSILQRSHTLQVVTPVCLTILIPTARLQTADSNRP